ncbi:uncharacterized protein B0H18DRAFT_630160 [Fomitopsis serialis]|uniref:uncharacterized protein n=1 Tax=Fomitopsis serialis TaxID=139415 RepID=UPI00200817A8|nr:uncharacterized protein B0H18DRAFT_630160 [Neoantrodia serialis]KAH9919625.1 hypothetical protein B0H18DRAFT_630160 [Neoantrodia serialis]
MKSQNPTGAPEEAWLKLADTAWAYEKNRADRWRNEINTLLTFAGLFSAVLTAFVVQYYAVLLPAPDFNMIILERILSLQLSNMATNAVVVAAANSSNPVPVPMALTNYLSTNLPPPPAAPRWIAALWFVALVFSLSAASVGLAVNQWLNFHATEQAGLQDASQSIWTWQLRRHALDKGQVENMVSILPSLLQVALVLFLVGIVGYLWELGFDIAVPSTVVVGALLLFLAFTSVSPALGGYSPYKSPQAWWIWKACIRTRWAVYWVVMLLHHMVDVLIKIQIPLQSSSIRVYNIYQRIKDLRASLVQHQARTRTLMMKKNWLEYEASCLDDWITHSKNNTIFRDIYSIANDIAVLRAMETCVRAMPSARAMRHVTQLGQTAFAALSNRQDSRSRAPRPPSGNQHDVPDSTSTTLIGHMVLDEFINIRPQTELDDDTQALDLDSNRRMLSGLIRAMPPTHGIEACMTLFQHLRDDRLSKKQRRATLDVVRNIYVPVDFLAEDLQDSKMQAARTYDCAPYTELYRLRDIENWECVQTALMTVSKLGDPVSTIQIMTIVLAICMLSVKNGHTLPHEPSRGAYLDDMLQRFDEYLATLRRKELKITIRHLPPPAVYILDWALARMSFSDIYSALGATEIRRNIMISTNHIARRLQWLLTRKAWTPQGAVQGFCVQLHWLVRLARMRSR